MPYASASMFFAGVYTSEMRVAYMQGFIDATRYSAGFFRSVGYGYVADWLLVTNLQQISYNLAPYGGVMQPMLDKMAGEVKLSATMKELPACFFFVSRWQSKEVAK